ncbi:SpaA isopeptide-forming pilin-related protein [bacterium]|nr:SpaA isopeptide-forming pilin-related protein [bacterium]
MVGPTVNCPGNEYFILYSVEDECGRTASCQQKFTIANDPPTIVCPADETVECYGDIHAGTPTVTTSCYLGYDVTTSGPHLVYGQVNCLDSKYEIIYTITDDCGRTSSCVQTFTIYNDPPTIVCPIDATVECVDDIMVGTPIISVPCGFNSIQTTVGPTFVSGLEGCNDAVYKIVYSVTDECGRTASCTQTFTIENDGPTIVCPADLTVECYGDIAAGVAIATTSCELPVIEITDPTLVSGTAGCDGAKYVIGYSVVDACGREASCAQTFTISNDGPTITCPADLTIECINEIVQGIPTVTSACGLSTEIFVAVPNIIGIGVNCPGLVYEILYRVVDECGRSASCVQTFTIANDGPTITCPADATVACAEDILEGTPTTTSSCNSITTVSTVGPILVSGTAGCDESTYKIIYTATDECGRTAECTQTFTLDNEGPTITCPADVTIECLNGLVQGVPTVTSACGLTTEVFVALPSIVGEGANCPGNQYQILYSVIDECGRTASCTQTFTIANQGPTIVCPADETVTCAYDINEGTPTVTSSCNLPTIVVTSDPVLVSGSANCYGAKYEITYTVTDVCGRTADCVQTFTIDNEIPEIICPANLTVECAEDIIAGSPAVSTSCGVGYVVTYSDPVLTYGTDNCDGAIYEIIYTVTDDCGRVNECSQLFTLDNEGPSITCPADLTIACASDIYEGTPTVVTSCGVHYTSLTTGPTLISGAADCYGAIYEITYTVIDVCGRSASCTQTFTIDNEAPMITCPADATVACAADIIVGVPTIETSCYLSSDYTTVGPVLVSGTDNCDGARYEITYNVEDVCGRTASCKQIFTVVNEGPSITCPADVTVECADDIHASIPNVTTSCDLGYTVSTSGPTLVSGTDNCTDATYKLTYTVTDECGRTANCVQTFKIENDPPTIVCPIDATVQCLDDIMVGTPVVTTPCYIPYTNSITGPTLVFGAGGCEGAIYEIVYSVLDACGRTASCTQTFTIENDGPTIVCPPNAFVECESDIAEGIPSVTSSCGYTTTVTTSGPVLTSGISDCNGATYEIIYTVTDECGRSADCTQVFTISNNGPTIVCPSDATVTCAYDISVGTPTVSSSCGVHTTVTTTGPTLVSGTAECHGATYQLTYTVTDVCGRSASCVQIFTLDNEGPSITCPADATVTCAYDIIVGTPFVTSSCNLGNVVTTSGPTLVYGNADCHGSSYELVYTVTDACGRSASCTQTFTIVNDGPTITCPHDVTVECVYDISVGTPSVTSSCNLGTVVTTSGPTLTHGVDNCAGASYVITYTVIDICGRSASCNQTFTIENDPLTIVCPIDATVECENDIKLGTPIVTTSCNMPSTTSTVGPTLVSGTRNCYGAKYEIVYSVVDACGRSASRTQTFTIVNEGPEITCPANVNITCINEITQGIPSVISACGLDTEIFVALPSIGTFQANCPGAYYQILYSAEDACGRSSSCVQTFTIVNDGPTITCPADATVTCVNDIKEGIATVQSSCGMPYTVNTSSPVLVSGTNGCHAAKYQITYTGIDECGRSAQCVQTFTLDNDGPTITCPSSVTLGRISEFVSGSATTTTSCGLSSNVTIGNPLLVSGNDCFGGVYEVTYTVTDECGRSASCAQQIFIEASDLFCSISGTDTNCGENNGVATGAANGGYRPYTYSWSNGSSLPSISGLAPGNYILTVTDSENCTSVCSITIDPSVNPICNATSVDATCGDANGSASVTVTQGTGPYTYLWSTNQTTSSINGLFSGIYTVVVTDALGCMTSCTVNIGDTVPATCMATATRTNCGENNGSATAFGMGGSGFYNYLWSTNEITATINNLAPGNYTVVITDGNGCTATATTSVGGSNTITASVTTTNTACGISNGTATANGFSGSGSYTYLWSTAATSQTISGLNAGTYNVTVTDSSTGCTATVTTSVGGSNVIVATATATNTACGISNGTATASGFNGSGNYTYYWSTAATSQTISGLSSGTYNVTVTDSNTGCTAMATTFVGGSNAKTASATATNTACGISNGTATGIGFNGSGSYSYLWSTTATSQTISGLNAGTYFVTVTDSNTGCTATATTSVGGSNAITANATGTDTSCGVSNGSATVTGFNGSGSYTYFWSTGATTQTIFGLSAGTYSVTLTDSNTGCTSTATTSVGGTNTITVNATGTFTTCGVSNGTATVTGFGGSGFYTYLWNTNATSQTITGLSSGNYNVTVTDSNTGCTGTATATVVGSNIITASVNSTDTSCDNNNGTASASGANGSGFYTYLWNTSATTQTITGLSDGTYSVTVTDANGNCSATAFTTIAPSTTISVAASASNTSCGASNGSATAIVSNGSGNYTYSWSNFGTTATITGLTPNSYSVTVTDVNSGCSAFATVVVTNSNPISCSVNGIDTNCGEYNGTATVNVVNGSGNYTYAWSNAGSTETITDLAPGVYTVTVTDNISGCTTTCQTSIDASVTISCFASSTATNCGVANGIATATVNNGTCNYSYMWSNAGTTASITGLNAGSYSVTITDNLSGCITSCSVSVDNSSSLTCNATSSASSCDLANGSATVTGFNGSGNYAYIWSNAAMTQTINNLAAGTYSVTITDMSTGCSTTCSTSVTSSSNIICNATSTKTSCGIANGSATVSVNNGSGNFTYLWSNSATTQIVAGLAAGTYTVTVTDVTSGCTTTCQTTVGSSNPIACSASGTGVNCGVSNGTATVSVTNGTGNYSYLWSNLYTSQTITGLAEGNYSVTVTDVASGCTTSCSVTISGSNTISCNATGTNASCGQSNGTATVSVSSGSGNYTYLWNTNNNTQSIYGLDAGTYSVTVTDATTGCTTNCSVFISESSAPTCNASSTNASCGFANGTASVTTFGGSGIYSYLWSNSLQTQTISNLTAGTYTVTVTDAAGCSTVCSATVSSTQAVTCAATSTNESCGTSNGTSSVTANGGTGSYTYLWSNGGTGSTIVGLSAGTYSVTVTDTQGCSSVCQTSLGSSNNAICSVTSIPENCGMMNGSATASASGGIAPYTYKWSNNSTTQSIINLATGTYTVTVTDVVGCSSISSVTVGSTSAPTAIMSSTSAACNLAGGTASVSASGGLGGYTYLWSNAATTSQIINIVAGTYSVTVTDSYGCSAVNSVVVNAAAAPTCTASSSPATCGVNNGTATVTAVGGSGGYSYAWNTAGNTATITNVLPGTYTVVVTDSNGCTATCTVDVGMILPTECEAVVSNTICGESNGTATVIASGGVGNYSYAWSNAETTSVISNLSAGTYSVTVTDGNGCSSVCEAIVTNSGGGPVCNLISEDATCGDANGTVSVTATQGQAPYTYLWNTTSTSDMITGLIGGNYTVTVTDATGCSSVCSTKVESLGGPSALVNTTDANCGASDGSATASAFGGNGLYTFMWSNGATTPDIFGLAPGTYTVTVTDQKGCKVIASGYLVNSQDNCNAEVGDYVWDDKDGDGIQDSGEDGVSGATVTLFDSAGNQVNQLITNDEGEYCFTGLIPGQYYIELTSLPVSYNDYVSTKHNPSLSGVNSDITNENGHWTTAIFPVSLGEVNKAIDLGVYKGGTIGNQVFCDNPLDGLMNLFDSNDTPFPGASISLYSFNTGTNEEVLVETQITDDNGHYLFKGLPAGVYRIEADVMALNKKFVSANSTYYDIALNDYIQDDNIDSDITFLVLEENMANGETHSVGRTNLITLMAGQENLTIDIGLGEGTVPLELVDFTGEWNDEDQITELEWITETEINSHFFAVERTTDLGEDFVEIGIVDAARNSVSTLFYDFNDTQVFESGTYYYRLRMVDLDGSYSYSNVIAVKVIFEGRDQEISLSVYPNPVIDEITVDVTVERDSEFEGGFYDAIGQLIKNFEVTTVKAGNNAIIIAIDDIPVGTYILRVRIDDNVLIEKISKTE